MTFKKTLLLSLLLLIPQQTRANLLNELVMPVGLFTGGILSLVGIYKLIVITQISQAQQNYPKYQAQWYRILNAYEANKNWYSLIASQSPSNVSITPLHDAEMELATTINEITSHYNNLKGHKEHAQLRADFLTLQNRLKNLFKALASLRTMQEYSIEEAILMRKSFDALRNLANMPTVTYIHTY